MKSWQKISSIVFILLVLALLFVQIKLTKPKTTSQSFTQSFIALETVVQIKLTSYAQQSTIDSIFNVVKKQIARMDSIFSDYYQGGVVFGINQAAGEDTIIIESQELIEVLQQSDCIFNRSNGLFDPTICPLKRLWNFEGGRQVPPPIDSLQAAIDLVGWGEVYFEGNRFYLPRHGMALDLGAIAKGYIIQSIKDTLRKLDIITGGLVEIGGDIASWGIKPDGSNWLVGIRHPRESGEIVVAVRLSDMSIATSGDYERTFTYDDIRYHHILNPETGQPARAFQSVTVIAEDAMLADALATTVFLCGWDKGIEIAKQVAQAEVMVIDSLGNRNQTEGFSAFIDTTVTELVK